MSKSLFFLVIIFPFLFPMESTTSVDFSNGNPRETRLLMDTTDITKPSLEMASSDGLFINSGTSVLSPFPCTPNFYHTYTGGAIGTYDLANFPTAFSDIATLGFNVNGTGYNPVDNFLYTIRKTDLHPIRIHSDGSFDDLGDIGLTIDAVIGGFDPGGLWYIKDGNFSPIAVINVSVVPPTFTTVDPGTNFDGKDWAYHLGNSLFYGVHRSGGVTTLWSYDPAGNVVNSSVLTGFLAGDGVTYGSTFAAADGYIYVVNNVSGNIYRIDVDNSEAHFVLQGPPPTSASDGDSCPGAMPPFPVICAHHDTICVPVTGSASVDIHLNDDTNLTGLDFSSFSILVAPTNGTTSYDNTTGTLTYTPTGAPVNDVLQYQICGDDPNPDLVTCDYANVVFIPEPAITFPTFGPYCVGDAAGNLPSTSNEGVAGSWSPSATINTTSAGIFNYTFTPDPTLVECGQPVTISITVDAITTPTFATFGPYCVGDAAGNLPSSSNESIAGTWTPSNNINTTTAGITVYTFTPDATLHPCAQNATVSITVDALENPTFATFGPYCVGDAAGNLPNSSNESITGNWTPSNNINTATAGTTVYTFTPDATLHPCAQNATVSITVDALENPTFATFGPYCLGDNAGNLPSNSLEGIGGIWTPSDFINTSNTGTTNYTFTPDPILHPCAQTTTISITVDPLLTPTFNTFGPFCLGDNAGNLPSNSLEGIGGIWTPSDFINTSNTGTTNYTFTPDPILHPCAQTTTISITVDPLLTPTFNTFGPFCLGDNAGNLPSNSLEGIGGIWTPSDFINTSNTGTTNYTFTPDPILHPCAQTTTISITVDPLLTPTFNTFGPFCLGDNAGNLPSNSLEGIGGTWMPSDFINTSNTGTTNYTFTPDPILHPCAQTTTISITVDPLLTPTFNTFGPFCLGDNAGNLPSNSLEGIGGIWTPSDFINTSNTGTTNYTFTPDPILHPCAQTTTISITVDPLLTPTFNTFGPYCLGDNAGNLPSNSLEGIGGTWTPSDFINTSNTGTTNYTFTPDPILHPCAQTTTISITVDPLLTPTFNTFGPFCLGDNAGNLPSNSLEGIGGTWMPSDFINTSNTGTTNYTFTPDPILHPCAQTTTISITVDPLLTPTFNTFGPFCLGDNAGNLPSNSLEGIGGTWMPSDFINTSNTGTTNYTFTPDPILHPCAQTTTISITVDPLLTPTFNTFGPFCLGDNAGNLPSNSLEGIGGIWTPSDFINTSNTGTTNYTFTPDPILHPCAQTTTISITVDPLLTPTFNTFGPFCLGDNAGNLPSNSLEGIGGTWTPSNNINTATAGTTNYTFTPDAILQPCAEIEIISIDVTPAITVNQVDFQCAADLLSYDLEITIAGGSGLYTTVEATPYTVIDNGGGSYTIQNILSGQNANINIIDDNNCSLNFPTTVQNCNCPNVSPPTGAMGNIFCFGENPTAIAVDNPGSGFQVNWYNDLNIFLSNNNPFTPSTSGTFLATIEETVSGCESTPVLVTLSENPEIIINQGAFNCAADLLTYDLQITISGGTAPYTVSEAGGLTINDDGAGNYTIIGIPSGTSAIVNVTDNQNCDNSLTTIPQNCDCPTVNPPTGALGNTFCFGESPTAISVDDPGAGFQINWYDGATFLTNDNPFTPANAGTFNATVVEIASGCESSPVAVTLSENPEIIINQGSFNCAADLLTYNLQITVSGGTAPYTVSETSGLTVNDDGAGNFTIIGIPSGSSATVNVTDNENCSNSLITIPQNCDCPTVNPPTGALGNTFCFGESPTAISVDDPGTGFQINWYDGATFLTNDNPFTPANAGTFNATVVEIASGCESSPVPVTLTENPEIIINQGSFNCAADLLTYNLQITVSGGTAPYTVSETSGLTVNDDGAGNFTIIGIPSGSSATVNVTDSENCSNSLITIPQNCDCNTPPAPTGALGNSFCFGENPTVISVDDPGTGFQINWYDGATFLTNDNPFTPANAGTFNATVVEIASGCESSPVPVTLTENPEIIINQGSFNCAADLLTYDLQITVSGGTAPYTVSENSGLTVNDDGAGNFTIIGIPSGSSTTVNVTDSENCSNSLITIPQNCDCPTINSPTGATGNAFCFGENPTVISVDDPGAGFQINWYDGATFLTNDNPFTPANAGTFNATVVEIASGCESSPVPVTLTENPEIIINQGSFNCAADLLTYNLQITVSGGTAPYTVSETSGLTVNDDGAGNFTIIGIPSGFSTTVNVTDSENCSNSLITIPQNCDCPTINSPTGALGNTFCFGESPTAISVDDPGAGFQINWYDGATFLTNDNPFTPANAGTFNATVVEIASGCESSPVPVTLSENPEIIINQGSFNCAADLLTYNLQITVSGGTAPYTVSETSGLTVNDDGAGNFTIIGIPSGTSATVNVTDNENCSNSLITIPQNCDCPTINSPTGATGNAFCFGENPTVISVDDPGAGFQINWYDGATFLTNDNPFTPANAGTFNATVVEIASGCESSPVPVTLTENPEIIINQGSFNCAADLLTYNLQITVSGGTAPYTVSETSGLTVNDDGAGNFTIIGIPSGSSATVNVTDNENCSNSLITIPQNCDCNTPPAPTGALGNSFCFGENPTVISVDDPGAGFQINWYDGATFLTNDNPFTPANAGTFNATVVEIASGCESSPVPITLSENPEIIINQGSFNCAADLLTYDLQITISGGTAPYTVSENSGLTINDDGAGNYTIIGIPSGTSAIVNVTDNQNCSNSLITIPQNCDCNTPPAPTGALGNSFCFGENPTVISVDDPGAGFQINWYDGATFLTNDNPFTPANAGTFNATVVEIASGCESSPVPITLSENPELTFTALENICANDTTLFDWTIVISGGTGPYQVNAGAFTVIENSPNEFSILALTGLSPVAISISDAAQCVLNDFTNPVILESPVANAGMDQVVSCDTPSVTLSGSGSNDNNYSWTGPGTFISTVQNPTVDIEGTYSLVVTSANGCTDIDITNVLLDDTLPLANAGLDQTITCLEECVTLQGSSDLANANYNWSGPDPNLDATAAAPVICVPGVYELIVSNNNNTCISNVATVTVITEINLPFVEAGQNQVLDCVSLEATLEGIVDSGNDFSWSNNTGIVSGEESLTPIINETGFYYLEVTNPMNGCVATDSVLVIDPEKPEPDFSLKTPDCHGDNDGILFIDSIVGGLEPFLFSIDENNSFSANNIFANLSGGSYTLTVQDANGCESETDIVITEPAPIVILLDSLVQVELGESHQIQAEVNLTDAQIDTLWWTPGDSLSCLDCLNPLATPIASSNYLLQIVDTFGCSAEARISIVVDTRLNVYAPNAFSPNGDGVNDAFTLYAGNGVQEIQKMQIFDRWGALVFSQENFSPGDERLGWDGSFKGEIMNPGVFVFWAEVLLVDGRVEIVKGDVGIVK